MLGFVALGPGSGQTSVAIAADSNAQQRPTFEPGPAHVQRRKLHGEEEEGERSDFAYVVGIMATACTFVFGYVVEHHHITWIPEAAIGLLMGMGAALACQYAGVPWMGMLKFDFEFFMTFLLPPIIFEAGFNMNIRAFFGNLGPTAFFAFVGTFASTFVVGGIVWYAGQLGYCYPLGLLASLTFGSLISATDPVTVLAVFQASRVALAVSSVQPQRAPARGSSAGGPARWRPCPRPLARTRSRAHSGPMVPGARRQGGPLLDGLRRVRAQRRRRHRALSHAPQFQRPRRRGGR